MQLLGSSGNQCNDANADCEGHYGNDIQYLTFHLVHTFAKFGIQAVGPWPIDVQ